VKWRVREDKGFRRIIGPGDAGLRYLSFSRLILESGNSWSGYTGAEEVAIVILAGTCSISSGNIKFDDIGRRQNVFSGKPSLVYLPRRSSYRIDASCWSEAAVIGALSDKDTEPSLVNPEDARESEVGVLNWRRKVIMALGSDKLADKLLVGETLSLPGNWSSVPSHKHDRDEPPRECELEEIYFFKLMPTQGFGLQWIYSDPNDGGDRLNEAIVVEDDDLVAITRGYHPVVAGPGYRLYYLWAMAGRNRKYGRFAVDPRHAWLNACEPIVSGSLEGRI